MFRGFNLSLETEFEGYKPKGKNEIRVNSANIKADIDKFLDKDGNIIADRIIKEWFPNKRFDVFISHSHRDIDRVSSLCGYLKERFGLSCFVDSEIWKYCDDLLRGIDDKYCWNQNSETYNYKKRNSTTAHVHNMLSIALAQMMDKCECLFFINTDNSIKNKVSDKYSERTSTYSPWIYYELSMLNLIRVKPPTRERLVSESRKDSTTSVMSSDSAPIQYTIDVSNMTDITQSDIYLWNTKNRDHRYSMGQHSLDVFYDLFPKKPNEFRHV
ncbi:TIR domain-containing protein [Komagataeibacter diospyri]|uniref:TIR domain-containing protein n=1 Tax=Komagataeibacter diospyri TaxID=1932662 RepID=A0A4P5NVM8_9PROT|nr:toll/interleukin-1 receptor domain-containing protein [Komagataeibacter diospyri]GCE83961.1 hypothetical protein MSKU9_2102 [Komagataeibacter diospyri]